ncbi:hypothetical protein CN373_24805 [Bacillus cereus]|uniref:Uncharacterized protein n=1 Tax=Bacillus cereus TaxID=1396 RepID=A0AA44Q5J8_BACCE|nr:hypothetical protein CN373_24805 [Bacillus cereus]PFM98250.1 hypothetical protein COJ55_26460 [Bacillus cereus]PFO75553.1 hypothetical protein COJ77_24665 [Bacillus cereus]PFR87236.1 hypothetical protein COK38_26320 [Bacillus cereus]PGZ11917.1 hypothetical protein COE46_24925 [Bacillus cereus]
MTAKNSASSHMLRAGFLFFININQNEQHTFLDGKEDPPEGRSGQGLFWPHALFQTKGEYGSNSLFVCIVIAHLLGF